MTAATPPIDLGLTPVGPRIDHDPKKSFWKDMGPLFGDVFRELGHTVDRRDANRRADGQVIFDGDGHEIFDETDRLHPEWQYQVVKMGALAGLLALGVGANQVYRRFDPVQLSQKLEGNFWTPVKGFVRRNARMINYAKAVVLDQGASSLLDLGLKKGLSDRRAHFATPTARVASALINSVPELEGYVNPISVQASLGIVEAAIATVAGREKVAQVMEGIDEVIAGERTPDGMVEIAMMFVAQYAAGKEKTRLNRLKYQAQPSRRPPDKQNRYNDPRVQIINDGRERIIIIR